MLHQKHVLPDTSMFDPETLKVSRRRHLETLVHEVGDFFRKCADPKIRRLFRTRKERSSKKTDPPKGHCAKFFLPMPSSHVFGGFMNQRLKKKQMVFFVDSKNHWATWRAFFLPAPSIVLWFPYIATIKSNLPHASPSPPHKVLQWKQCHWPIV